MTQDTLSAAAYRKAAGLPPPGADRDAKPQRRQTEDDLHRSVVDWLRSLDWHQPAPLWTHPASEEADKMKRIRDWRMGQEPGWPDFIFAIPNGRALFVELKTADGRQSTDQKNFDARVSLLGHVYVVARSIEEVCAALKRAGVGFREPAMARAMREAR